MLNATSIRRESRRPGATTFIAHINLYDEPQKLNPTDYSAFSILRKAYLSERGPLVGNERFAIQSCMQNCCQSTQTLSPEEGLKLAPGFDPAATPLRKTRDAGAATPRPVSPILQPTASSNQRTASQSYGQLGLGLTKRFLSLISEYITPPLRGGYVLVTSSSNLHDLN